MSSYLSPPPSAIDTRPRSGTNISTASSSSSPSALIQTPPFPYILSALSTSPYIQTPTGNSAQLSPETPNLEYPFPPALLPGETATKRTLGQSVRKKLERSKSSFKLLALTKGTPAVDSTNDQDSPSRPRARRLKSFMTLSRSGSSTPLEAEPSLEELRAAFRPGPVPDAPVLVEPPMLIPAQQPIQPNHPTPGVLHRQRVLTLTSLEKRRKFRRRTNHFDEMPRELQIYTMKTLLGLWSAAPRTTKWSGEVGGRRELIKLCRVSKSWYSLCTDGQLWSVMDLTPFAFSMPTTTLSRLLTNAGPFVTDLSLRNHDALCDSQLIANVGFEIRLQSLLHLDLRGCKGFSTTAIVMMISASPNLLSLNLKGVQNVTPYVLRVINNNSEQLQSLNVSRCRRIDIADIVIFVDGSSDDQLAHLRILRIAGLRASHDGGTYCMSALAKRATNLEVLDMGGCHGVTDAAWKAWADWSGGRSKLKHLNISGCSALTIWTPWNLRGKLPNVTTFEMASHSDMFKHDHSPPNKTRALIMLLLTMPKLERLDLEGTGLFGGINDDTLKALSPVQPGEGVEGRFSELRHVNLSFARRITPEGLINFIQAATKLERLEVDNTPADAAVMREFHRNRRSSSASISVLDCERIRSEDYAEVANTSRPREGWEGYSANAFRYTGAELKSIDSGVVKAFWSWKRVSPPPQWDIARDLPPAEEVEIVAPGERHYDRPNFGPSRYHSTRGRRRSWWGGNDPDEEDIHDRNCVIM